MKSSSVVVAIAWFLTPQMMAGREVNASASHSIPDRHRVFCSFFCAVALRCYAEECAFSLSTQAQDHVWDLVEYKRVEPAHCPTGATSGGTGCERNIMRGIPPAFFMRAPCSLHDWGVTLLFCFWLDSSMRPGGTVCSRVLGRA